MNDIKFPCNQCCIDANIELNKKYEKLKVVYDQLAKNNTELRDRLKQLNDLKPTLNSISQYAFALFVVGILPHLLVGRQ